MQWADTLLELTGYSAEELSAALERSEETAELVATAWNAGSQTVDEQKRQLLARAAAASILDDPTVLVDDRSLFIRTLGQVEVPDMKLLVLIAEGVRHIQGIEVAGAWSHEAIIDAWPGVAGSIDLLISTLSGAGLIHDTGGANFNTFGGGAQWNVTNYGRRFTDFVRTGAPSIVPDIES